MSLDSDLSLNKQLEVLSLSKGTYYYEPKGESEYNEQIMKKIDEIHTENPARGVNGMVLDLIAMNFIVGPKRVRRLMRKMRIYAAMPRRSLSKLGNAKYIRPYLLRGLAVTRPRHVWCIDITYIPMAKGFMYLTAIIEVYSRAIMAWGLYNTLDAANSIEVLDEAVRLHGSPEIINSDQGSQFTSKDWTEACEKYSITISLRKSDLKDGEITYRRRKTNQKLSILWTKEMQDIIDKYPANDSDYLLPIIKKKSVNERYAYLNTSYKINRLLKVIATMIASPINLTMYVARHSWASAAKAKGVPLSVISEGMGHDSEATTQIYLASLDASVVDKANHLIISSL